jgi:RimJ/RimL family protein N-acetyltransferase
MSHDEARTFAVIAASDLVFDLSQCAEIRGITDARNIHSIGVLERSGFKQVAAQETIFNGERCTGLVYSLRRNDA